MKKAAGRVEQHLASNSSRQPQRFTLGAMSPNSSRKKREAAAQGAKNPVDSPGVDERILMGTVGCFKSQLSTH